MIQSDACLTLSLGIRVCKAKLPFSGAIESQYARVSGVRSKFPIRDLNRLSYSEVANRQCLRDPSPETTHSDEYCIPKPAL